jgi:dephospho-CoA kinase
MLWVGLTGGIASGKSTVSKLFKKSGIPVVDADELARRAVEKGTEPYQKVLSHFGPGVLSPDGSLDRRKLGAMVFSNPAELSFLESVIHPFVQEQVRESKKIFEGQGHSFAAYDVPLLFEKSLESQFDRIVVVGCTRQTQLDRMIRRDGLSREEALQRLSNQLDLEAKMKKASDVIWNEGTLQELELQVQNLIQKLRKSSSKA